VEPAEAQRLVHRFTVVHGADIEALLAEIAQQQFAQARVVVDDEDTR
jgi:hypothetical protein